MKKIPIHSFKKVLQIRLWRSVFIFFLIPLAFAIHQGCIPPGDPVFSFVILADPHIAGSSENDSRLLACVDWINANRDPEGIELVMVVGDIAWGNGQVERARQMLDGLSIPYIPLIGDNEIHNGSEEEIVLQWASHYDALASQLENWQKAPGPVWNPQYNQYSYFQNFSFDHKGVHFTGLDWVTRLIDPVLGEQADLHDFEGGTWQWFINDVTSCTKGRKENIVMLSHHPMHHLLLGAFDQQEIGQIENFTGTYGDYVSADFAGHYHLNLQYNLALGQFMTYITDATWDDQNTLRLVHVTDDGSSFYYTHELVVLQ